MKHFMVITVLGLLCASCGSGINSYEDGFEANTEIMVEMVDILEGVTDQASAEAAEDEIEALGNRLANIMVELKKLPPPTTEQLRQFAESQQEKMQEFQKKAMPQMMKLTQYPSLLAAWTRAMENMQ